MRRVGSFSSSLDLPNVELEPPERPPFTGQEPPERPPFTEQEPPRVQNVELEPPERLPFTGEEPPRVQNVELEQPELQNVESEQPELQNVKLDTAMIVESMSIFIYKSKYFRHSLECAVCELAIKENEFVLQKHCQHTFHAHCIEMYVLSNPTCPICGTSGEPVLPIFESARIEPILATISEESTSAIYDNLSASSGEEFNPQNPTAISSSGKQKQIVAEIEEIDEGTSGGRAFSTPVEAHRPCSPNGSQSSSSSPVTRVTSPTRIASRDREWIAVFPSDHPTECEDGNNDQ
jgi:hypothetical protein